MPTIPRSLRTGALACILVTGCAGRQTAVSEGGTGGGDHFPQLKDARTLFHEGLALIVEHDRRRAWTPEACARISAKFLEAEKAVHSDTGKRWHEARYDAGVALQRCGDTAGARSIFESILAEDSKAHRARVQIVRMDLAASNGKGLDKAISELRRAVLDADYQNVEALVELARSQMARGARTADDDGPDDFSRANKNLRRALALDDQSMPAANQLAIYYLVSAKARAGDPTPPFSRASTATASQVEAQALEMALLVASQASRKDPAYAPIHNTLGVIAFEQGNLTAAARSFDRARQLDSKFYEAHMNYAAVNLGFRGFAEAEAGYRAALAARHDDYEAILGLALALRARIDEDKDPAARVKEVELMLETAKRLEQARPEAYFNHAVLAESYGTAVMGHGFEPVVRARALYEEFVKRANGRKDLGKDVADVVARPTKPDEQCLGPTAKNDPSCKRGRLYDIDAMIGDPGVSSSDRKAADERARSRAAADELSAP